MLSKQQIRKGASVVAEMETRRNKIAAQFRGDMRYYSLKRRHAHRQITLSIGSKSLRDMIHSRYAVDMRRALKPTLDNLTREIRALSERLALEECPHWLPCGADDQWYEIRDQWRVMLKRWAQAYKFLRFVERMKPDNKICRRIGT